MFCKALFFFFSISFRELAKTRIMSYYIVLRKDSCPGRIRTQRPTGQNDGDIYDSF